LLNIIKPSATRLDGYSIDDKEWSKWSKVDAIPDFRSGFSNPASGYSTALDYATYIGMQKPSWNIMWNEFGFASISRGMNIKPAKEPFCLAAQPHEPGHIAFETPLLELSCQQLSLLPGDQLVFVMGISDSSRREIMLYDLHSKQLAAMAKGYSPVVLLDGTTQELSIKRPGERSRSTSQER